MCCAPAWWSRSSRPCSSPRSASGRASSTMFSSPSPAPSCCRRTRSICSVSTSLYLRLFRFGVFEPRHGLDRLLGRSGEHNLPVVGLLQLRDRNGDVVAPEPDKPSRTDDGEGHGPVRGNDEVIDDTDLRVVFVVDGLAEDLLLGTPA